MKKLYLHIGTHKTGSTAVQAFARRHGRELERHGLLYPEAGRPRLKRFASGHHLLPWTRMEHVGWKPAWGDRAGHPLRVWDDLLRELADSSCDKALLSSEEFDVLGDDDIAFVARQLEGFEVEVICYLRRLDAFVQSYYATDVLYHGETRGVEDYLGGMRTTLDYFELIERWRKGFGSSNVRIRFYTPSGLSEGDIVADVLEQTGIDITEIRRGGRSRFVDWGAPSARLVERVRGMNERGVSPFLVRLVVIAARTVSSLGSRRESSLLSDAEKRKLADYGLQRIRLLESGSLTPEVEAELRVE